MTEKIGSDNSEKKFTIGISGLGLIGGSFAKAYSAAGHTVLAYDTDRQMLDFAKLSGAVKEDLTRDNMKDCDLILLCAYPHAVIEFLENESPYIGPKPIVMDCCGTKRVVVEAGRKAAKQYGFLYVGGHPMAGTQFAGFKNAKEDMFAGAPMVIIPPVGDDIHLLTRIKDLLSPCGFGSITVSSPDLHDELIAFTSQLAHVVSCSYIKSPTAKEHEGLSAGSYRDMTRVARLNPQMWADLFLDNRDYLIREIDSLVGNIRDLRDAMERGDRDALVQLLEEGRRMKEKIDG